VYERASSSSSFTIYEALVVFPNYRLSGLSLNASRQSLLREGIVNDTLQFLRIILLTIRASLHFRSCISDCQEELLWKRKLYQEIV